MHNSKSPAQICAGLFCRFALPTLAMHLHMWICKIAKMQKCNVLKFSVLQKSPLCNLQIWAKKGCFWGGVLARNLWFSCKIREETGKKQKLHLTFTGVCESSEYSAYSEWLGVVRKLGKLRTIWRQVSLIAASCSLPGVVSICQRTLALERWCMWCRACVSALLWGGWHSRLVQGLAMGFFWKICASAESHLRVRASAKKLPFLSAVTVGGISCCKDSAKNLRNARYGALLRVIAR